MAENKKKKTETFASIFGDESEDIIESKNKDKDGTTTLNINDLIPFENHPFKLYEGARLDDMVDSIKNYGIIVPIVVRKKDNQYQILSGHNRVNSAKIVGLSEVPAIIKENLTEEEATLIVTETNLMQRSFTDLTHSERATVIATRYNAMKSQGVRTDLLNKIEQLSKVRNLAADETSRPMGEKLNSDKNLAKEYGISP
ncbi:ParB N-terminal domain-containing protein [Clostridiisalibacter paucivorans]|uniref:ParB N-terminal domain-containing protein n=1 Tax=Clostridiisalibacter paucivorans TaxID=408753 RepID=UPI000685E574|nr:ParB N-terminal domain-containing protein [Clostridiisalibacter paucivorans]